MPTLTHADREALARLYCEAVGFNPDESVAYSGGFVLNDNGECRQIEVPRHRALAGKLAEFYAMYRACQMFDAREEP